MALKDLVSVALSFSQLRSRNVYSMNHLPHPRPPSQLHERASCARATAAGNLHAARAHHVQPSTGMNALLFFMRHFVRPRQS